MDITLVKPNSDYEEYELHKELYARLENTLKVAWISFPRGCENISLLTDETVANRFEHNPGTRNMRVRLNCDANGAGTLRIYHDGVPFHDLTANPRPELVADIINRLQLDYSANYVDEGDTPLVFGAMKVCRIISFQLRN